MGLLITIEGGEYTGKTSLVIPGLLKVFRDAGICVKTSREPGGTKRGEELRKKIFKRHAEGALQDELALLFNKARRVHLQEVIMPTLGIHLEKDAVLVLDRYLDSTRVYQGLEGGVSLDKIFKLEQEYVGDFFPDLTLILYFRDKIFDKVFAIRQAYERANKDSSRDVTTWDDGKIAAHRARQKLYLTLPELAKQNGERRAFAKIDASASPVEVIRKCVSECSKIILTSKRKITTTARTTEDFLRVVSSLAEQGVWNSIENLWKTQQKNLRKKNIV